MLNSKIFTNLEIKDKIEIQLSGLTSQLEHYLQPSLKV